MQSDPEFSVTSALVTLQELTQLSGDLGFRPNAPRKLANGIEHFDGVTLWVAPTSSNP